MVMVGRNGGGLSAPKLIPGVEISLEVKPPNSNEVDTNCVGDL